MDQDTAKGYALADFEGIVSYSSKLQDDLVKYPSRHVNIIIASVVAMISFAELLSGGKAFDISSATDKYRIVVAFVFGSLTLNGIIYVILMARSRRHYVKLVNGTNSIRDRYCKVLDLERELGPLWTKSKITSWPKDSATTWCLAMMIFLILLTSIVALRVSSVSWCYSVPSALLLAGFSGYIANKISG